MRFFSDNAAAAHPKVIEAIAASNRVDTAYDGDEWSQRLDGAFSDLFETEVRALWVTTGTAANCLALAALCPPYRGIICHQRRAYRGRRGGRSGLLHRRRQADAARWAGREDHAGCSFGPPATSSATTSTRSSRQRSRSPTRPNMGWSIAPPRWRRSAKFAKQRGLALPHGRRAASPMRSRPPGESSADVTWRAGVDAMSFGFVKNGGLNAEALILFRTELADEIAVRRKRAGHLLSKGRMLAAQILAMLEDGSVARQCARRQCRRADARRAPRRTGWSIRSKRTRFSSTSARDEAAASAQRRASTSTTGDRARSGSSPAGTSRAKRSTGSPRQFARCDRDKRGLSASGALRLAPDPTDPLLQRSMKPRDLAEAELSDGHSERPGSVVIPFIIFTAIWGSTWIVIRGQLGTVAAAMVGDLPLRRRCARDGAHSRDGRATSLQHRPEGPARRGVPRLHPVLRELQRRLSRRAAYHVGRRRDGVRVAADPGDPARLALLGQRPSRRFAWSSLVAVAGIALLFVHEIREHPADRSQIAAGIGLTLVGMLGAAIANVCPGATRDPSLSRCSRCWPGRWPLER